MRKEILTNITNEISFKAYNNSIGEIRYKNILKKGARIFENKKIYSSSYIGDINNDSLFKQARKNKDSAISFNYKLNSIESISKEIYLPNRNENNLYKAFEDALFELNREHPNFIFNGQAKLSRVSRAINFQEEGTQNISYDKCEWNLGYKKKGSANIVDGFFGTTSIADFNIKKYCNQYSNYLDVFTNEVSLKDGYYPVVFVQSGGLLGKVLESVRADNYHNKIGIFSNKLDELILNKSFSLYDVSYDPDINAVNLFDYEGFIRKNHYLPIIENGIFKNLISDLRNSNKYSIKPTGNGQGSFDSNINLDFNTPIVKGGIRTSDEILKDIPNCIIAELAIGGSFTDNGDYATPVQNGYLMQNGNLIGRIPQITLTSSIKEMFDTQLIEISKDPFGMIEKNPAIFMNMKVINN